MAVSNIESAGEFLNNSIKNWDAEKVADELFKLRVNAIDFAVKFGGYNDIPFQSTAGIEVKAIAASENNKQNLKLAVEHVIQNVPPENDSVKHFLDALNYIHSPNRYKSVSRLARQVRSPQSCEEAVDMEDSSESNLSYWGIRKRSKPCQRNRVYIAFFKTLNEHPSYFNKSDGFVG